LTTQREGEKLKVWDNFGFCSVVHGVETITCWAESPADIWRCMQCQTKKGSEWRN